MTKGYFSGLWAETRFILRRDRVRLPVWLLGIVSFTVLCVPLLANMFGTPQELAIMGQIMENPAMIAMIGPPFGVENYTVGAMYANMMLVIMAMLAGAMNIFFVTRHTRQDEELGRLEVLRSLPVGRLAGLTATLKVAFAQNLLMALGIGFGMAAFGIESMPLGACLLLGAAMGGAGLVFATATAVFCQISSSNRTASGFALTFLMAAYLLRAIGDIGPEVLSLISPLGLISRTQVFVGNDLWPIWVLLLASIVLSTLALVLNNLRDLDQGILATRPGRKHGSPLLSSPLGLALRLTRTTLIGWGVVLVVFGAMYGSVLNEMEGFIDGSPWLQTMFAVPDGHSVTDHFVGFLMVILSFVAAIPILSLMLRLWGEEKGGYTEKILATRTSRQALFGAYFGIAFVASIVFQTLAGVSFWGAASVVMDPIPDFFVYLQAALNYLPAVWLLLGLAVALVGFFPSRASLAYAYLGIAFFLVYLGTVAQLPAWTEKLSPFGYIPRLPIEAQTWLPLAGLTGIFIVLSILGFIGYRKRDLKTS